MAKFDHAQSNAINATYILSIISLATGIFGWVLGVFILLTGFTPPFHLFSVRSDCWSISNHIARLQLPYSHYYWNHWGKANQTKRPFATLTQSRQFLAVKYLSLAGYLSQNLYIVIH